MRAFLQEESHRRIQWVYSSTSNQELEERYNQWATEYERDMAEEFEWHSPARAADLFAKHVAVEGRILDVGAGTGLVGECLARLGYRDLHAMDLSLGMLEEARGKGLYKEFYQMTLGEELGFETDSFDSVISVGVFTTGHAPAYAFDELVRITKPRRDDRFQPADRLVRGRRVQGVPSRTGRGGQVEAGRAVGPLPSPAQRGAGGGPPNLGLPGYGVGRRQ